MVYNEKINSLLAKAWSSRNEEQYVDAKDSADEAFKLCKQDDHNSLGRIYHTYGQIAVDQHLFEQALEYSEISVDNYKKTKIQSKIAHSTRHLADIQLQLGKLGQAESNYRKSISIYRKESTASPLDLANSLRGFALLLEKKKSIKEAINAWNETKGLYQKCGIEEGVREANSKLNALK